MIKITKEEKERLNYKYHVTLFGSGNDTTNKKYLDDAEVLARGIAERNHVLVNGASEKGLMGVSGRTAFNAGGEVYGVGLNDYEPEIHSWFSNWDGYSSYEHRIKRLNELGDVFISMMGGLGTLHEILDIHINQFLGKEIRPVIIMSPMAEMYKGICDRTKEEGLYWDSLPEYIYFVKDAKEALDKLDEIILKYDKSGYINKSYYPVMNANEIYDHIQKYNEKYSILYFGSKLVIHPDVYPPNRFRSSLTFGEYITEDVFRGKDVIEIGTGPGNLSILAAQKKAKKVIASEINPAAVKNARENVKLLGLENIEVRQGSGFETIKEGEEADIILFHPPFHSEKIEKDKTKLMNSVSTDEFNVLNIFFRDVKKKLKKDGVVYLGFSNKDQKSLDYLYKLMEEDFKIEVLKHKYKDSSADYLLFKLIQKK